MPTPTPVRRSAVQPAAQVVDLRSVLRGLRRRGQVVLAAVLIGIVGAGAFVTLSPTVYVAAARVVLPPSPVDAQGRDIRDINTEIQIVRGTAVLAPTTNTVTPSIELSALQQAITVRRISSQIIEIAAHTGSAARSAQLANAVAASYVAFADDTATAEANATAAAYSQEVSHLTQQVQQLDQQIAGNTAALAGLAPAEVQRRQAVIDALGSEQSTLALQLNNDQARIATAQLQAQLSRQGTQVLQPAVRPTQPSSPKPPVDLALGAVAGALIGGIVALALENADHRLRTRDSISAAVDAPVLASMAVQAPARPEDCRIFLERWEPSVVENYALHHALARLESIDGLGGHLVVVAMDGDTAAAAVALELAVFSAARGTPTAFVFASHDESTGRLRAACTAAAPGGVSPRPGLTILGGAGPVTSERLVGSDLVVTLVVADSGPIMLPTWDRPTKVVLAVSAGSGTGDRLEAVAAACLDAGIPLCGVFVANPDPGDRSTGHQGGAVAMNGNLWSATDRLDHLSSGNGAAVNGAAANGTAATSGAAVNGMVGGHGTAGHAGAAQAQPARSDAGGNPEGGVPG